MDGRIIDCCSLLNLFTGLQGLGALRSLPHQWCIPEAVLKEAQFVREYTSDRRDFVEVPLDLQPFVESGLLQIARLEDAEEFTDYIDIVTEIRDKGEAEALAIAKHRKYVLVTDDRKALSLARRPGISVTTITTVDVVREWKDRLGVENAVVRNAIERIEFLSRWRPRRGSPDDVWWQDQLNN